MWVGVSSTIFERCNLFIAKFSIIINEKPAFITFSFVSLRGTSNRLKHSFIIGAS